MGKTARLAAFLLLTTAPMVAPAWAWELNGTKSVSLITRDGATLPIGSVTFQPQGDHVGFSLHLDTGRFKDFFLSMKEFKCLEGPDEIQCHVPYPYANPATIRGDDFSWLEHSLLFLHKTPKEFGAKLWNGLYYRLKRTDKGLVGTPMEVDLNAIASPPDDPSRPPFGPEARTDIAPGSRWITGLEIR
jgi:hypothetical protein